MNRRLVLGLLAAFFLVTSTLGLFIGFKPAQRNFSYEGLCSGTVVDVRATELLVYSLAEINITGERMGAFIRTSASLLPEIKEKNLLYWVNGYVRVQIKGNELTIPAFLLPERNMGDRVMLECTVLVNNGIVEHASAIETLAT